MTRATKGYKREQGLTLVQLNAIDLLITGKTDQGVAEEIDVNRVTITKWRNYDVHFRAELNKRRKELLGSSMDRMRALIPKAVQRLEKEVDNENGWKIALEILKITGINSRDLMGIGHDEVDKILTTEAKIKLDEELFNQVSDHSKQELLNEYQEKLNQCKEIKRP
ncbi:hypothetical protein MUN89_00930 [Halobacillus salinarum]|uniref:Homeodomain phBC6A51-type domain-containing protein n=1 Tax=Halobacillus salinarum TaxID=2932257 RepID=A0ABY4ER33_9BACI|nr:hypothetical protein [Halobacillus salinarum]UOQ44576.1 hypothetical protein MUN89_00930 [Halobacillus salinarum]